MNQLYAELHKAGYMIVPDESRPLPERWGLFKITGEQIGPWHATLADVLRAGKAILNPQITFTVIARFNRGLGPEHIAMESVMANTPAEAQAKASSQAEEYFRLAAGFEKAILLGVQIRPAG